MKNYLLDTQIFIKGFSTTRITSEENSKAVRGSSHNKICKLCLFWEIAYLLDSKPHVFKLKVPLTAFINEALMSLRIITLNLSPEHSQRFYEIQPIKDHKDIFDRMLIAQASSSGFIMVSTDLKFSNYPIKLFDY